MDLRERVVRAVKEEGLSRHEVAKRFGVGIATAIVLFGVQILDADPGSVLQAV
jgi:transposase